MGLSIDPGECVQVEGVLLIGPNQRHWQPEATIDGVDFAELAWRAFGNAARCGVLVRVTIERLPRMEIMNDSPSG